MTENRKKLEAEEIVTVTGGENKKVEDMMVASASKKIEDMPMVSNAPAPAVAGTAGNKKVEDTL